MVATSVSLRALKSGYLYLALPLTQGVTRQTFLFFENLLLYLPDAHRDPIVLPIARIQD